MFKNVAELEAKLAEPSDKLIEDLKKIEGDIMLLGVGGKMGPSLARLAGNAIREGGLNKKIYGVSRFSNEETRRELEEAGVRTISCDLLDDEALRSLPNVDNVIYMAGNKFGTTGKEYFTWAMNSYLPGRVSEKYKDSRIVVFSSGNVYPFVPVSSGGVTEAVSPDPIGEYAQSCLGRERVFEYFSHKYNIPMAIYRLNYAVDMRYGVLLEVARAVNEGRPIHLATGHVNVIWQGDANEMAIRCLTVCDTPPQIVNVTGPETISIRWVAQEFARRLGKEPQFVGTESDTALLNNAAKAFKLFGYPRVSLLQLIDWTAEWVAAGNTTWNKPTHFQEREGKF
ncbi:NAD-dependent epimerase/dehydratase family protein [Paenibacillus thermoaerophilus]|uniref:NAD-dependent epimerase/dehydratase family protein n=1 Tax=Paenibacillus thermoaerophilus TaxID=1215385 RepID=A0ABW2V150_9BACL|nr:NAD(P)-dependent oxidoreductase [Paenibacillus thermoaerophilus]TMV17356.1 NAD(P)-dependent oxidoreductase [Paenibacillus thermoaerophilus]